VADRRPLVLVDGRLARRRRTGIATYIAHLARALEEAAPADLRVEWMFGPPGLPRRGWHTSIGNLVLDSLWLHVWVPLTAWRRRAAAVHAPMNWAPWWTPCPTVVTVQDLCWERLPEAYPSGFRRYASLLARRSTRRARVVVAVSRATADDVERLYRVPGRRLRVVPIGVEPDGAPPLGAPDAREPFVLAVGELEPRKRVTALVEGHRRYWESAPADPPPCRLLVAGAGGSEEEAVRRAAGPGCELLGFVSDEELRRLYRRATLLVYPSACEGFGLPVAEAMAHGCPTLVARTAALVEVGGDPALVIEEPDAAGIARALTEALGDREALARRGEDARRRAARFGWDGAAAGTLAAYREAIA
jgi:glycosyltransferase involved in cell wall biosynthesis